MALNELLKVDIDTNQILQRAEGKKDLVTFPSSIKGVGYVIDKQEALIISSRGGYLRVAARNMKQIISELKYLDEEMERRSRD